MLTSIHRSLFAINNPQLQESLHFNVPCTLLMIYLFYYYTNFVVIIASKIDSYPITVVYAFSPVLALASSLYMHLLFLSCIRLKHLKLSEIHIHFILFVHSFQTSLFHCCIFCRHFVRNRKLTKEKQKMRKLGFSRFLSQKISPF